MTISGIYSVHRDSLYATVTLFLPEPATRLGSDYRTLLIEFTTKRTTPLKFHEKKRSIGEINSKCREVATEKSMV